jgi:hypothetical protein
MLMFVSMISAMTQTLSCTFSTVSVWRLRWQSMMLLTLLSHISVESIVAWMPLSSDTSRMPLLEMLPGTAQLSVPLTSVVDTTRRF